MMKCSNCRKQKEPNEFEMKKNGSPYKTCCKCRKKPEGTKPAERKFNKKEYMKEYYQANKKVMDDDAAEYYNIVYAKDTPKTYVDPSKYNTKYFKDNKDRIQQRRKNVAEAKRVINMYPEIFLKKNKNVKEVVKEMLDCPDFAHLFK